MDINFDVGHTYTRWLETVNKRFWLPSKRELIIMFWLMGSWKTERTYFMARKNAEIGNKVMYISLELPEYDMKLRIARKRAWVNKYDFQTGNYTLEQKSIMNAEFAKIDKQENLLIISPENKDLWTIMTLMRQWYDKGYKMYVIDNLDKILAMDREDENKRCQRITSELQDYKNENNCTVLLIHHAKKPENKNGYISPWWIAGMRWSQKIMDNATQVIEIFRDLDPDCPPEDRSRVTITQMKDTFEGSNWFVDIYFHKWDYQETPPWRDKSKDPF